MGFGNNSMSTMGTNRGMNATSFGNTTGSATNFGQGQNRPGSLTGSGTTTTGSTLNPGVVYGTTIRFNTPTVVPSAVQTRLSDVISRSTSLTVPGNIKVHLDRGVIVLQGTVASDEEARHAENLVRLEPGVREVRNELQIQK